MIKHLQGEDKQIEGLKPLFVDMFQKPWPKVIASQWVYTDFTTWNYTRPKYFSFFRDPFLRFQSFIAHEVSRNSIDIRHF